MARNILQEPIRNVLKKLKVGKKVKVKASYGKTTVKKTVKVKK